MSFQPAKPTQNLPELEMQIIATWEKNKIFERSVSERPEDDQFKFYDGPPFATGLPHYGHILASTIKDAIPRYQTMRGKRVERKWGWDCHGLPIENIVEEELQLGSKEEIEKYGIDKFCESCRSKVLRYTDDWEKTIRRLGRFVDMKNCYRTMDLSYMDSVWWVFKQLWEENLIYESKKSIHYCPRCDTPLSNFEVTQGYKDITDESATVKFELVDEPGTFILAWTTTPWTLPGNVALAIGEHIEYVKIKFENQTLILAKARLENIMKDKEYEIISEVKPHELIGKHYKPLFDYDAKKYAEVLDPNNSVDDLWENYCTVQVADFVSTEDGTGIVHIAPAFGEDDFNLAKAKQLPLLRHVQPNGHFVKEVTDFPNMEVKPKKDPSLTDQIVNKFLESKNKLFAKEKYRHSYPHCWRCDSPLLNYTTPSWFVRIEEIKKQMLEANEQINWVPEHLKHGRFGQWLEGARDWAISRNRFWGAPLPVWKCEKCGEVKCVESSEELSKLSGQKVTDIHKHFVDKITFECKCGGTAKRIPEVLDCWFESGSMPYAQFATRENSAIPADFIAEGLDQTRGWFYTLTVLSAALSSRGKLKGIKKTKPAFSNCVVNGIVLAEDGKKMSKKLKNYPDPNLIFEKYGADAMRFYLLNSPVVKAEDLRFSEKGVEEVVRNVILPFWNAYSFFVTYANTDGWQPQAKNPTATHPLDKWILSRLNTVIAQMTTHLDHYEINEATDQIPLFLDELNNWYIRRSRRRFWKSENDTDKNQAYATLYHVLVNVSKLFAPFAPFVSDAVYQNLTNEDSVHLALWPKSEKKKIDTTLEEQTATVREIIRLGLRARATAKIKNRQPVAKFVVGLEKTLQKNIADQIQVIQEELNTKNLEFTEGEKLASRVVDVNARVLGPRVGGKVQMIIKEVKAGNYQIEKEGVKVGDELLTGEEYKVRFVPNENADHNLSIEANLQGLVVALDTALTPELEMEGQRNDLNRAIQDLRKEAGLEVADRIILSIIGNDALVEKYREYFAEEALATEIRTAKLNTPLATKEIPLATIQIQKVDV